MTTKNLNWGVIGFGNASQNFIKNFDNNLLSKISSIASITKCDFLTKNIKTSL